MGSTLRVGLPLALAAMLAGCATMDSGGDATGGMAPEGYGVERVAAGERNAGRDWSRVDTNGDGSVSAEEMERWLAANPGPDKR